MNIKKFKNILFSITTIFILSISNFAYSAGTTYQDIQSASSKTNDRSRQALETIFGSVVSDPFSPTTTGDTLVSSVFKVFNSSLLVIAVFFAGYLIFKKLTQTAHDGNVFDQQKNTFWMPLRTAMGVAFIIPTANGWSMAQLIMLWATSVIGIGVANLASDAALDSFNNGNSMVIQPTSPDTRTVADELFKNNLCLHAINASIQNAISQSALMPNASLVQLKPVENPKGFMLKSDSVICGGAMVPYLYSNLTKLKQGMTNALSFLIPQIAEIDIADAHAQQLSIMQESMNTSAKQFLDAYIANRKGIKTEYPKVNQVIAQAATVYENNINEAIVLKQGDLVSLSAEINDSIKEKGWAVLGSWYQTFAQANTKLSSQVAAKANLYPPSVNMDASVATLYGEALAVYQSRKDSEFGANPVGTIATDAENNKAQMEKTDRKFQAKDVSSIFHDVFGNIGQSILKALISFNFGSGTNDSNQYNPIIKMKNIGDVIMIGTEMGLVAYTALHVAKHVATGFSFTGIFVQGANFLSGGAVDAIIGVLEGVDSFMVAMLLAYFFFGLVLSIYIPMIPFIIWFGALINWIVVVGEAVVAAPLWALTHLGSEGDGLGHKTGHGYIFILNVMIRPVLMVIGFFLGGAIVIVGGTMLTEFFSVAVSNAQFDSLTGYPSLLAFIVLYVSMSINLIHHSFNLIFIVPDQVINWVGGHASSQLGRDDANQVKGMMTGANAHAKGMMEKFASSKGGKGGKEWKTDINKPGEKGSGGSNTNTLGKNAGKLK